VDENPLKEHTTPTHLKSVHVCLSENNANKHTSCDQQCHTVWIKCMFALLL